MISYRLENDGDIRAPFFRGSTPEGLTYICLYVLKRHVEGLDSTTKAVHICFSASVPKGVGEEDAFNLLPKYPYVEAYIPSPMDPSLYRNEATLLDSKIKLLASSLWDKGYRYAWIEYEE